MKRKPDFSSMSKKQIIEYVWDYYKIPIIIFIFIICSLISSLYKNITAKKSILELIMVNSTSSYDGAMGSDDFIVQQGLDPKKYEIHATSSFRMSLSEENYAEDYYVIQTLIARLTEGDVDVFGGTPEVFKEFAMEGYFADLRDYYTEEELAAYESLLVYTIHPDTQETYPCGFNLGDSAWNERYYYFDGDCQFGILFNADNADTSKNFLTYAITY